MSCKLLPGVAMVHAEILSYLHIYKYRLCRSTHTVKVTSVAYAPTCADNGIQGSCEETRQQRGRSSAAQTLNCNKQGVNA